MFKIKEYDNVTDYAKKTVISTIIILVLLSFGFCKTNFLISLISLYLLLTYAIVKSIALFQSVNVSNEKNIKFSWLTRVKYKVI